MNIQVYASVGFLLVLAGVADAQDPDRGAAPVSSTESISSSVPSELLAPPASAPSDGVSPDPAATSTSSGFGAVQLPPPTPPSGTDICDTADCVPAGSKSGTKLKFPAVVIGPAAQKALNQSHDWAENPSAMPSRDVGGRVVFPFSQSVPTIVCAPIHVCDVELQTGEVVQGSPHVGDSIRWKISPAISGSDEKRVTHLIIKPTEAGLDTNLIVPTDRHTYHIRLVSSSTRYVSSVGFYYPGEEQQSWSEGSANGRSGSGSTGEGPQDMPSVAVNRLNFDYKIKVVKGKPQFRPLRAMDDGYHTYISMNEDMPQTEAPVLVGMTSAGKDQILNYRLKGNMFVIDGTVPKLALISGTGRDQERVELTRDPCRARGWLGICWDAKE